MKFLLSSESQTFSLGTKIADILQGGEIVLLIGEMGAGKTALTKGIAHGLKIQSQINSPTFTLLNTYQGTITLHHFDLFRLQTLDEVEETGITEYFGNPDSVCVIEWPDLVLDVLPKQNIVKINLEYIDQNTRKATILLDESKATNHNIAILSGAK